MRAAPCSAAAPGDRAACALVGEFAPRPLGPCAQHGGDALTHEIVDARCETETHLLLGGVDVHVHVLGRHVQKEDEDGVTLHRHEAAVGRIRRVDEKTVADGASVHEQILRAARGAVEPGRARPAAERHALRRGARNLEQMRSDAASPTSCAARVKTPPEASRSSSVLLPWRRMNETFGFAMAA